ncbi:sulfotransferase [Thermobifida cellulosilytica]|uniref:Sulfotransferase n=1 Tax=Thermobifida cellulosilytica TB100 TaxID=665004 RepID=A0A147KIT6_THECS|nr:sulfotransferase [Thermobifida cellulosilytica]KUP97119.1 sulfotransferase [Thermobifida cellulosilytica TB100]
MKQPPHILVVNGTKVRRPVFVLGAPHSGVDLIARALRRVPGFHIGGGHPSVLDAVRAVARQPSMVHTRESGTAVLLRDALAESWVLTPATCARCRGLSVPLREAVEPCRHAAEAQRYGDAGPDLLYSATALARAFSDAAFIQIIRDGRDVVADMLDDEQQLAWFKPGAANLDEEFPHPFFGVETEEERERYPELSPAGKCALRWRSAVRLSARLRAELSEDQLITVRYEEIAGAEIPTAKRLSEFVGARVSAVELVNTGDDGIGSWRTRLDSQQRADVLNAARPELTRLGYL